MYIFNCHTHCKVANGLFPLMGLTFEIIQMLILTFNLFLLKSTLLRFWLCSWYNNTYHASDLAEQSKHWFGHLYMVGIILPSKTTTVRGITLTAAHSGSIWKFAMQAKGQLISECLLGVIVWTKIPTKKFPRFLP